MKRLRLIVFVFLLCACGQPEKTEIKNANAPDETQIAENRVARLVKEKEAIAPFFAKMGVPQKDDWLKNNFEPGETFQEYVKNKPTTPTAEKHTIYIQPAGVFSDRQRKILLLTAKYLRVFYNLPVQLKSEKLLTDVPKKWTRKNEYYGQTQIETTYFLDEFLPKIMPDDAAALISLTTADLYPPEKWSFVFGQADLRGRVGVWSLYRLENAEKSAANDEKLLARTLKIAMHETGHIFSMRHCTKYECLMSGTNHLDETDRRPLDVCPECAAKISWAMNYDLQERCTKLANFWREQNWTAEANSFIKKAEAIRSVKREYLKENN